MGKVYIGVTRLAGTNYGVVGGKRVAGSGILGNGWAMEGVTAGGGEVAGRACPAPTGGWKEAGGQASTSGESPSHPIFTQVLHVPP